VYDKAAGFVTIFLIAYNCEEKPHKQTVEKQVILALLPADDLANGSIPTNSLLKEMIIE